MAEGFPISELREGKADVCRAILSSLPEWFGIPELVDAYVAAADALPMLVARMADGEVAGFLALKFHTAVAAEAYVLGVRREWHRKGVGKALFAAAEEMAGLRGCRYLTVKTLAASHPDPNYRNTRLFYEALGFEPIEVFPDLWGAWNPCLLMLKRVDSR